jgi:hypothetical protein
MRITVIARTTVYAEIIHARRGWERLFLTATLTADTAEMANVNWRPARILTPAGPTVESVEMAHVTNLPVRPMRLARPTVYAEMESVSQMRISATAPATVRYAATASAVTDLVRMQRYVLRTAAGQLESERGYL